MKRLQFGEKLNTSMKIDTNPLHVDEANFVEPGEVCMAEVTEDLDDELSPVVSQMVAL